MKISLLYPNLNQFQDHITHLCRAQVVFNLEHFSFLRDCAGYPAKMSQLDLFSFSSEMSFSLSPIPCISCRLEVHLKAHWSIFLLEYFISTIAELHYETHDNPPLVMLNLTSSDDGPFLTIKRLPDSEKPWGTWKRKGEKRQAWVHGQQGACFSGTGLWSSPLWWEILTTSMHSMLPACPARNCTGPRGGAHDPEGSIWAWLCSQQACVPGTTVLCFGLGHLRKS